MKVNQNNKNLVPFLILTIIALVFGLAYNPESKETTVFIAKYSEDGKLVQYEVDRGGIDSLGGGISFKSKNSQNITVLCENDKYFIQKGKDEKQTGKILGLKFK